MCVKCRCQALTPSSDWNLREGPRNLEFLRRQGSWLTLATMFALGVLPGAVPGAVPVGRYRAGDPAPRLYLTTPHLLSDFQDLHPG